MLLILVKLSQALVGNAYKLGWLVGLRAYVLVRLLENLYFLVSITNLAPSLLLLVVELIEYGCEL